MNSIKIENIDKVFGHVSLEVIVDKDKINSRFIVTQDARLIENVILGKHFYEVPDIASRICGACSISHLLASIRAFENALGIEVSEEVEKLREVINEIEVVQNHLVHLYLLALPDYMGCTSINDLLRKDINLVKRVFKFNELCLKVIEILAGRIVGPTKCTIGGFAKEIRNENLNIALKILKDLEEYAYSTLELFLNIDLPKYKDIENNHISIFDTEDYKFLGYYLQTNEKLVFKVNEYKNYIREEEVDYSTCKRCFLKDKPYYVGPRARLNLNWDRMEPEVKEIALRVIPLESPFDNIRAKAIEIVQCVKHSIQLMEELVGKNLPKAEKVEKIKESEGYGLVEAPRGVLIHHYKIDNHGRVTYANIITPTTMNSHHIERNATNIAQELLSNGENLDNLKQILTKLVRAYDPCLPCATHLVKIKVRR